MKIGVLGAGRMAGALGTRFAAAGHQLMIGARKPDAAASLATTIGKGSAHGLGGTQIVRDEGHFCHRDDPYPTSELLERLIA